MPKMQRMLGMLQIPVQGDGLVDRWGLSRSRRDANRSLQSPCNWRRFECDHRGGSSTRYAAGKRPAENSVKLGKREHELEIVSYATLLDRIRRVLPIGNPLKLGKSVQTSLPPVGEEKSPA